MQYESQAPTATPTSTFDRVCASLDHMLWLPVPVGCANCHIRPHMHRCCYMRLWAVRVYGTHLHQQPRVHVADFMHLHSVRDHEPNINFTPRVHGAYDLHVNAVRVTGTDCHSHFHL